MKTIRFTAYPDGYRCSEPGDQSGDYLRVDTRIEALLTVAEQLRTQDNRMTMNPMFCVQQKRGKHWETVSVAFTEKGAEEYLRQDGHNLHEPRIYVMSFNRCPEMIAIREFLMSL